MKYVIFGVALLATALLLDGCGDQYRYTCQDPANWEKPVCKRPRCAVTGTCPDQLLTPETLKEDSK